MKKIIIISLILSALILQSCYKSDNIQDTLKAVNSKTYIMTSPYKNTSITITFNNDKVYGYSGVNKYLGNIKINKDKSITFTNLSTTKMAGMETDMKMEKDFISNLKASKNIKLNNNKLLIGNMAFIEKK